MDFLRFFRCCSLALLICNSHLAAAVIVHSTTQFQLPTGSAIATPYVRGNSRAVVLHFQPRESASAEVLVDATTGTPWAGDLSTLLQDFTRLGSESPQLIASGSAPDLRLLRELGCTQQHLMCTSPLDADVLVFVHRGLSGQATVDVLDLQPLYAELEEVLSGTRAGAELRWSATEWLAIESASTRPARRARWLDAVRRVQTPAQYQRLRDSFSGGVMLGRRSVFTGGPGMDLRAEIEVLGHRLLVRMLAAAALQRLDTSSDAALAEAIESSVRPPNEIGVAAKVVDELIDRPDEQRLSLNVALRRQAISRQSQTLHCFSQWVLARACSETTAPWQAPAAPGSRSSGPSAAAPAAAPRLPTTVARLAPYAGIPGIAAQVPDPHRAGGSGSGVLAADAPQEWGLITGLPNKLVLLAFNEASGLMVPEAGVLGGFSFTARSVGDTREGRFEIQIQPSSTAPLRLAHGQYRVRVRLTLDFVREDQCRSGLSCLLGRAQRHAKSERREVAFNISAAGRYTDRQRSDFGHLLPLLADGSQRYQSELKDVRLAVESVRFELL